MVRSTSHELYGVRISGEVYSLLKDLRDNCPRNLGKVDIDVALSLITCRKRDFITSYDQLNEIVIILSRICGDSRRFVALKIMSYYSDNFPSKVDSLQSYITYMPMDTIDMKQQLTDDTGDKTQQAQTSLAANSIKEEQDELDSEDPDNELLLRDLTATLSIKHGKRRRLSKISTRNQKSSRSQSTDTGGMTLSSLLSTLMNKPIKRAQIEARKEYSKQIDESRACYGCPVQYDVEFQDLAMKVMEYELLTTFSYLQKPIVAHSPSEKRHFFIPGNTLPFCSTSLPMIYPMLGTIMTAPADFLCRPRLLGRKVTRPMTGKIPPHKVSAYLYDPHLLDYTRHNDGDDPSDLRIELRPAWTHASEFSKAVHDQPGELLWKYPMYRLVTQKPVPEHHSLIDLTGCYVPADALFDSFITELAKLAHSVAANQRKQLLFAMRQQAAQRKQPIDLPSIFNESLTLRTPQLINTDLSTDVDDDLYVSTTEDDTIVGSSTADISDEDSDTSEQSPSLVILHLLERLQRIIFFPPFRVCVDQRHFGTISRYARFVEDPFDATCYVKAVGVSGSTRLQLHAAKDLPANAELTLHAGTFSWVKSDSELMKYVYILEKYLVFTDTLVAKCPWKSLMNDFSNEFAEASRASIDSAMLTTLAELRLKEDSSSLLTTKRIDLDFITWLSNQLYDVCYNEDPLITSFQQVNISLNKILDPKNVVINSTNLRCNVLVNPQNIFTHSLHSQNCSINIATTDTSFSMNGYYLYNFFLTHKFFNDQMSLDALAKQLFLSDDQERQLLMYLINVQLTAIYTDIDGGTSPVAKKLQIPAFIFTPFNKDKLSNLDVPLSISALRREGNIVDVENYTVSDSDSWTNSPQILILKETGYIDKLENVSLRDLRERLLTLHKQHPSYTVYEISTDRYFIALIKGYIDSTPAKPSVVMKIFPSYYSAWTPFSPILEVQSLTFDPLLMRIFLTLTKCYKNYKLLSDFITGLSPIPVQPTNLSSTNIATSAVDKVLSQTILPYSTIPLALDEQVDALLLRLVHQNTYFNLISYGMNLTKQQYIDMTQQLISSPLHFSLTESWSHPLELFEVTSLSSPLQFFIKYFLESRKLSSASFKSILLTLKKSNVMYNYNNTNLVREASIFSDAILDMLCTDILTLLHSIPPLSGKHKQGKAKRTMIQKETIWPGSKGYAPPGYNGQYARTSLHGICSHLSLSVNDKLTEELHSSINTKGKENSFPVSSHTYFKSPVLRRVFLDAQAAFRRKSKV